MGKLMNNVLGWLLLFQAKDPTSAIVNCFAIEDYKRKAGNGA
jgi:hypothetical protein